MVDGLVLRYRTQDTKDSPQAGEGAFLPCSFWYTDNLVLLGRVDEAKALFQRLIGLCNDVGLLAEEYDPRARERMLGNFPQAFSHVALGQYRASPHPGTARAGSRRSKEAAGRLRQVAIMLLAFASCVHL